MIEPHKIFGRLGNSLFQYSTLYALARDNNVDYYFQDEKWFKKYEQEIKALFGQDIGFIPEVSIHVRRGDYLKPPHSEFHRDMCSTDYYERAIALFPDDRFIVFSDDIAWCKEKFVGDRFHFSEGNDEITDLNLMASCKGNIITNSTFSWWAAYLNPNPAKKVVSPSENSWFCDKIIRTKVPESWTQIEIK